MRVLLRLGVDPDTRDTLGRSALHAAIGRPAGPAVVRVLLDVRRLKVDARDAVGRTPLMLAAQVGKRAALALLLAAGADVDAADDFGLTALMHAVVTGVAPTRALLDYGADASVRDTAGATALHHVGLSPGETDVARPLVDAGAEVGARDGRGRMPLARRSRRAARRA